MSQPFVRFPIPTLDTATDSIPKLNVGTGVSVLNADDLPLIMSVLHGSIASPVTENRPTMAVSRYEAKTADGQGGQSPAIYASTVADNTSVAGSNPQAIAANMRVTQNGQGDACAFFGDAFMNSADWRAFGGFCHANAAVFHSKGTGLEIGVTCNNGFDNSVLDGSFSTIGINIEVDGANTGFAGISFANDSGGEWASGIYFDTNCVKTALIYGGPGTVVNGFDLSGATISGSAYKSNGFSVDGSGNLTATSLSETSAWTAFTCTATPGAGSITTQSSTSKYKKIGKTVFISIDVSISNIGTGSGSVTLSLPFATGGQMTITGRESAVSGKVILGMAGNGASGIILTNYDNSGPSFSNGVNYVMTGVYMST